MSDQKPIDEIPVQTPQRLSFELHMAGPRARRAPVRAEDLNYYALQKGRFGQGAGERNNRRRPLCQRAPGYLKIFCSSGCRGIWRGCITTEHTPNGPLYHRPSGAQRGKIESFFHHTEFGSLSLSGQNNQNLDRTCHMAHNGWF